MGLFLQNFETPYCCLCGDKGKPTGEHKIKHSVLKAEFGDDSLYVGSLGNSSSKMKLAQSANSKHLKFETRICEACNSSRTQIPDREFSNFISKAKELSLAENGLHSVFELEEYQQGTKEHIGVSRYFAKLLCCHLAEVGAPRARRLSDFAIGRLEKNCISMEVGVDPFSSQLKTKFEISEYAAHGGLGVRCRPTEGVVTQFSSSVTIGVVQYGFSMDMNWFENLELRMSHSLFYKKCLTQAEQTKAEAPT
jgi:hypothetical protein